MKVWKDRLKLPQLVFLLFIIKMVTYYILIDVNLLTNPFALISVALLGIMFAAFSTSRMKWKKGWFLLLYTLFSIVMFADSMYYNYYNQTVSIKQLWQVANVAKVPSSFVATLIPASFILVLDIPLVFYYFNRKAKASLAKSGKEPAKRSVRNLALALSGCAAVLVLAVNPMKSRLFERINSVEFFTNHVKDVYDAAFADNNMSHVSAEEVMKTVEENKETPDTKRLTGIAGGKNLILIQVEALQNFVIGAEYNGQELTPNLNRLLDRDTLYFDHYYSIIGKGNTADAEFATLNSLYPVIDAECYRLYQDNTYNGLPWLLKEKGYETFAVHGYEGSFWNREEAYPYQGIDEYYSMEDLTQDEVIGLGISDQSMFRQAVELMKGKRQPFFSFLITLTNHHPFLLDEDKQGIVLSEEHKGTKFGSYLETVHYTDQAIGAFLEELKEAGLYEDTVIALYGDHHGLNCRMDDNDIYVSDFIGRNYDFDEMLKVPLMIHIPGSGAGQTISTLGSQVDFLPTIANLMSLSAAQPFVLGQDLVNADHGFAAFTAYLFEGSFASDRVMFEVSREGVFEGSRAFEIGSGRELDPSSYQKEYDKALALKQASLNILNQDLISGYIKRKAPDLPE